MSFGASNSASRKSKIVLVILLVFACGAMTGAVAARYRYRGSAIKAASAAQKTWKEGGKEISVEHFRKELTLTDDQTREVAEVLDDFMKYYQTLQAQMDDVRANGKDRILTILNPEQRDKFGRMMTEMQSRQQIK
jgi:Spy/CpxP family protein refolding chaperone